MKKRQIDNVDKQLELFNAPRAEVWSYSRLKSLRRCALEYKVRWLDGGKSAFQPNHTDVQAGRLLHNIVREYYSLPARPEPYQVLLELYKKIAPTSLRWQEDLQGEFRTMQALRLFADSAVSKFKPVAQELACNAQIGGTTFVGRADLIYHSEEHGEVSGILEFKLNNSEMRASDPSETFLQCLIYYLGLPEKYRSANRYVGAYIFDIGQFLEKEIEDSMIEKAVEIIHSALRHADGPDFPPSVNPLCSSCGYQNLCPARSRL